MIGKVKWNWAGYVARRKGNRWKTRITFWTSRGHTLRNLRRPRTKWREDLDSFVKHCHRVAQNIDQWRTKGKATSNDGYLLTDQLNDVISPEFVYFTHFLNLNISGTKADTVNDIFNLSGIPYHKIQGTWIDHSSTLKLHRIYLLPFALIKNKERKTFHLAFKFGASYLSSYYK